MGVLSDLVVAIHAGGVEVIDLTAPLSAETPILRLPEPLGQTWRFGLQEISRYDEAGPAWYWNNITTGEHTGTHLDAPIHWITGKDGADVSQLAPSRLIAPAAVLDFSAESAADPDFLLEVGISVECARWLAETAPVIGVGVETVGTDAGAAHGFTPAFPCHSFLLGHHKYGLTQLQNLARLPPTGAVLFVGPVPIVRGSGSPCRALALVERAEHTERAERT